MPFGRFNTFPFRFGGSTPLARKIYDALNASLGTAYDTSYDSTVTAETSAEARLIAASWHANSRAANQLDPDRVSDFLARWEVLLGIPTRTSDTDAVRRARIKAKRVAVGNPNAQTISTLCSSALGSVFIGVEFVPLANAVQRWPGNGYATAWSSTTAHILIRVACPPTMARVQFVALCQYCVSLLNDFLPDWTTVTYGEFNSFGTRGFRLDEPHNLDSQTFA